MKTSLYRAGMILSALLSVGACGGAADSLHIERSWHEARYGVWKDPEDPSAGDDSDFSLWYSTVEFPDGYNWRLDSLFGAVDCTVRLWKDTVLVREFSAGKALGISPEADTPFICDGEFYSYFTAFGTTRIFRGGVELCRWDSTGEILKGLMPLGGAVYTLSQGMESLTLRKDGEVILEKQDATVLGALEESASDPWGALYADMGEVCFVYTKGDGWYAVQGEEITRVDAGRDITEIAGARFFGGVLYVLGKDTSSGPVRLYAPEAKLNLSYPEAREDASLRLESCKEGVFFISSYSFLGSPVMELWVQQGKLLSMKADRLEPLLSVNGLAYIAVNGGELSWYSHTAGGLSSREGRLMSVRCCAWGDGKLHLATIENGQSVLHSGDSEKSADWNGYISCLGR